MRWQGREQITLQKCDAIADPMAGRVGASDLQSLLRNVCGEYNRRPQRLRTAHSNTPAPGADVDDEEPGSGIWRRGTDGRFPPSAGSRRSRRGGSRAPAFPSSHPLDDTLDKNLRLRPGNHHPLIDGKGEPHKLTLPDDIGNGPASRTFVQDALKLVPRILGDRTVPPRVERGAVQLEDVPEEDLSFDRRFCAPRRGEVFAALQIRLSNSNRHRYQSASTRSTKSSRSSGSTCSWRWSVLVDLGDPGDMADLSGRMSRDPLGRRRSQRLEFRCGQGLGQLIQISIQHDVETVQGQADAVVGDAALWKVVGANLLAALAGAHLHAPLQCDSLLLAVDLPLQQFGPQNAHRLFTVLMLGPLVLAGHDEAAGEMVDPHGGFPPVGVLAAGAPGTKRFDLDLLPPNLHVHPFGLRQHGHGRC